MSPRPAPPPKAVRRAGSIRRTAAIGRKRSKPPPRRKETHRVGRRIRSRDVRVIDADGSQLGIMLTQDAVARAEEQNLQLVEVNPKTNPPVCKIMDYGKFKYETAKRERETKRTRRVQELKEVKFRPKTHEHDFDFKVKHARRFLEEGDKVRLLVQFRGREITHPETGRDVLNRVVKALADLATVGQMPSMEGNRMSMILAPKPGRVIKPKSTAAPKVRAAPGEGGIVPAGAEGAVEEEDLDEDDDDFDEDDEDEDDDDEDEDEDEDGEAEEEAPAPETDAKT